MMLATFALLFAFTGSVVLTLKAIVLNLLSLSATLGAMVFIFQEGHLKWLVGDFTATGGYDATRRLFEQRPDVDAVFAASDLAAIGVLRALRELGRRPGDDVAVIGFDDITAAVEQQPPL